MSKTPASQNFISTSNQMHLWNISEEEKNRYLTDLDNETLPLMIPAFIFLVTVMVVGFVGNITVLLVYWRKFKPSTTRCFILSLAVLDLITCVFCIPGEIADLRYFYSFDYPGLCKIIRFNNTLFAISSGLTLIAVATDRFLKICRPMKKQITISLARIMVMISCCAALVLTIPATVLNGKLSVPTDRKEINGSTCSFDDKYKDTLFPLVYNAVLFLIFSAFLIVLIVMYILIGRTVWKHRQFHFSEHIQTSQSKTGVCTDVSCTDLSSNECTTKEDTEKQPHRDESSAINQGKEIGPSIMEPKQRLTNTEEDSGITIHENSIYMEPINNDSDKIKGRKTNPKHTFPKEKSKHGKAKSKIGKVTTMLFLVTVVFILTFLPHLILMVMRGADSTFLDRLNVSGVMTYHVFIRSYFISSAANCIIYSFWNVKFRTHCRELLCKRV